MADVGLNADIGGSPYKLWLGVAFIGAASLVAWWLSDPQQGGPPRATATGQAVSTHCTQFIALAKANFGANWKVRLDPRDPLCAQEIQRAWESQRIPRETLAETMRVGPIVPQPVQPADGAAAWDAVTASRTSTYCLNVMSLVRSRFGAGWHATLTPEEAAICQEQIQRIRR